MRDLEAIREPSGGASATEAHSRLTELLEEAVEPRAKLVRPLGMADELIGLLSEELG
ncbi:MAG TPA: hypothetical protein VFG72_17390 [Marmoricola sp.]|nr:hypothetical protein [Marmoricola sp.]